MTEGDRLRFIRACSEVIGARRTGSGIGTYNEKTLHSVLKTYICDDKNCHEIKIYPETPFENEPGFRDAGYIADLLVDCEIYEIQTGGLYPLAQKVRFYLDSTCYNLTVVIPVAAGKWINWIDPVTSEVGKRHKSPKKESERDVLPELYWIAPYLNNRRLRVRVMLLEIEEFRIRNGWDESGKRGSERYERIPTGLHGICDFSVPADYIHLLPATLPAEFTAAAFGKHSRLSGRRLYAALKVFCAVGLIAPAGRSGRATLYIKK